MTQTSIKMTATLTWYDLSANGAGYIMSHLNKPDLKQCRPVDKKTYVEAMRCIFKELRVATARGKSKKLDKTFKSPHLISPVEGLRVESDAFNDEAGFRRLTKRLRNHLLKVFEL
jgi:hypothetical protein